MHRIETLTALLVPALVMGLCTATPARASKSELIDIAWTADGGFGRDVPVSSKQFVEVCGRLAAGAVVDWRFEAGSGLDFNVHFHEGKEVRFPARQAKVAKAEGTLEAPVDQDYCWMWTNPTAAEVRLSFQLRRR